MPQDNAGLLRIPSDFDMSGLSQSQFGSSQASSPCELNVRRVCRRHTSSMAHFIIDVGFSNGRRRSSAVCYTSTIPGSSCRCRRAYGQPLPPVRAKFPAQPGQESTHPDLPTSLGLLSISTLCVEGRSTRQSESALENGSREVRTSAQSGTLQNIRPCATCQIGR